MRRTLGAIAIFVSFVSVAAAQEQQNPYAALGTIKSLYFVSGYFGTSDAAKELGVSERSYDNFVVAKVRQLFSDVPYRKIDTSKAVNTKSTTEGRVACRIMHVKAAEYPIVAIHVRCDVGLMTEDIWSHEQILLAGDLRIKDAVMNATENVLVQAAGEFYKARATRR